MKREARTKYVLIFLTAFIASFAVATAYLLKHNDVSRVEASDQSSIACTSEAKLCPDGSYVGRVAPFCQFAPCK